ncbi:ComF family protein [bacterium]|nr:ComF family protein [bacterium]
MKVDWEKLPANLLDLLLDGVFPRHCLACGRDDQLRDGQVCERCLNSLVSTVPFEKPKQLDSLIIGFAYNDTLRPIIHHYKFHNGTSLANLLASKLADRLKELNLKFEDSVLIPVPDHPARRRERGYNPSELLAKALGEKIGVIHSSKLTVRYRYGHHQSLMTPDKREKLAKDAFQALPPPNSDFRAVIVDDVIRTGATLNQLAKTLKKAGWKRVEGLVLCG